MLNARTFKPLKKNKDKSENVGKERKEGKEGKEVENVVEIDINELGAILRGLWRIRNKAIRELTEPEHQQFRKIVDIVNDVYDTQQCSVFLDVIKRYFDDTDDIQPGTIGAYFSGCLINNSNCAPICDTILPDKCERNFCKDNIIWMYNTDGAEVLGNNSLIVLNRVKTSERAFLFINLLGNLAGNLVGNVMNNYGLTEEEKQQLIVLGIKEVKMIGYVSDNKSYLDLTNWIPVNQIKSRISITPSFGASIDQSNSMDTTDTMDTTDKTDNSNVTIMLLVIGIILILLFFIWRMSIHYS